MISQADGARLMAAHEKAVEAAGDAGAARWTKPMGDRRPDYIAIRDAAERAFAELVAKLTEKPRHVAQNGFNPLSWLTRDFR